MRRSTRIITSSRTRRCRHTRRRLTACQHRCLCQRQCPTMRTTLLWLLRQMSPRRTCPSTLRCTRPRCSTVRRGWLHPFPTTTLPRTTTTQRIWYPGRQGRWTYTHSWANCTCTRRYRRTRRTMVWITTAWTRRSSKLSWEIASRGNCQKSVLRWVWIIFIIQKRFEWYLLLKNNKNLTKPTTLQTNKILPEQLFPLTRKT